jgi:hypothetical protein
MGEVGLQLKEQLKPEADLLQELQQKVNLQSQKVAQIESEQRNMVAGVEIVARFKESISDASYSSLNELARLMKSKLPSSEHASLLFANGPKSKSNTAATAGISSTRTLRRSSPPGMPCYTRIPRSLGTVGISHWARSGRRGARRSQGVER